MTRTIRIFFFAVLLPAFLTTKASAIEPPIVHSHVTDLAGVLSAADLASLDGTLAAYEQSSTNQLVVLIVPSLQGESIEDFSLKVAVANKIGQKGKDNGALLLVSIQDRKLRFEVGYGLEGTLTDAMTSMIIRDIIAPEFREQNYAKGITDGMQAAIKTVSGEFTAPPTQARRYQKRSNRWSTGGVILFIVIMIIMGWVKAFGGTKWAMPVVSGIAEKFN